MINITIMGINPETKTVVADREVFVNPAHISIMEPYKGEYTEQIKTIIRLTNGDVLGIKETMKYMKDTYEAVTKQQFVGAFKY